MLLSSGLRSALIESRCQRSAKEDAYMVVAEGPNDFILYMQNDHGDLSGQFAVHWGNETFPALQPRERFEYTLMRK